jgi:DNA-binding helix-hairpin-helix protein with protein kinase domain
VAKLLHRAEHSDLGERLRVMLSGGLEWTVCDGQPIVAWPVAAVHHRDTGALLGYAAPHLAAPAFAPLPVLFNPAARRQLRPVITWSWWLIVAEHLARTVHTVHQRGHAIGDLAPANLFVAMSGAVCLIDADGWQLSDPGRSRSLPCPFSRPEYTAPEHLDDPDRPRRPSSDNWALAVLIGQTLSLGFHPFGGVPPEARGPIEEVDNVRARQCRPLGARLRAPASAPPADLLAGVLRLRLAEAVETGYDDPSVRPEPLAWAAALAYTRRRLVTCPVSAAHVHPPELPRCPWCAMVARGAADPYPTTAGRRP